MILVCTVVVSTVQRSAGLNQPQPYLSKTLLELPSNAEFSLAGLVYPSY